MVEDAPWAEEIPLNARKWPACCGLSALRVARFESWAKRARVTNSKPSSPHSHVICLRKRHKHHNPHKYRPKWVSGIRHKSEV